jgi:hypothetical protein
MTNFRWSRVFAACILTLMTAAPAHALRWFTWIDELSGPGRFNGYQFNGEVLCLGTVANTSSLEKATNTLQTLAATPLSPDLLFASALSEGRQRAEITLSVETQDALIASIQTLVNNTAKASVAAQDATQVARKFPLCRSDRENAVTAIVFEYGRFDDRHSEHEDRYTGVTRLSNAQLIAYLPLHRLLGPDVPPTPVTRAIEFGAGAGFYHLTGTTVKNTEEWMPAIPLRIRIIPAEFFYKDPGDRSDTGSTKRHLWQAFQFKVGWDYIPTKARWNELLQSTGGGTGFQDSDSQELVGTWGFQLDLGQVAWALFGKEPQH